MWLATGHVIQSLEERLPGPDILCWFLAGGAVFAFLFASAFIAFWMEKGQVTLAGFADRFRFQPIHRADLWLSLAVLLISGLLSAVIWAVWLWASNFFAFLDEPNLSPSFMAVEPLTRQTLWVLGAWLPLFFFNIVGEELWWRGYMLPRQEQAHGKAAWIVHGLGLTVFHLPLGPHLTIIALPILFGLPLVVQRRRNLWTGFIVHGIFNAGGFLAVAFGLA